MNQDVLKWVGAVLAGAAWFALVIMGKADAGTFIQFLQFSILGLGVHAMSSPGATRMTAPAPAPAEPAKNAQGGWTRLLNLCMLALAAIVVALLFGCAAIPSPVVDAKKVSDDNVVENLRLMWCNLPIGAVLRHPEIQAYVVQACGPK